MDLRSEYDKIQDKLKATENALDMKILEIEAQNAKIAHLSERTLNYASEMDKLRRSCEESEGWLSNTEKRLEEQIQATESVQAEQQQRIEDISSVLSDTEQLLRRKEKSEVSR